MPPIIILHIILSLALINIAVSGDIVAKFASALVGIMSLWIVYYDLKYRKWYFTK